MINLTFSDKDSKICCLCNRIFIGWGNNPEPLKDSGVCCSVCDETKVIPARIEQYRKDSNNANKKTF